MWKKKPTETVWMNWMNGWCHVKSCQSDESCQTFVTENENEKCYGWRRGNNNNKKIHENLWHIHFSFAIYAFG